MIEEKVSGDMITVRDPKSITKGDMYGWPHLGGHVAARTR